MALTSNESDNEVIQQNYLGKVSQKWQLLPVEHYSWMDNVVVTIGSGSQPDPVEGWVHVSYADLNYDAGGNYIYLWVRGPNKDNLAVTYNSDVPTGEGWKKIEKDLNKGTGEDTAYIWLWVRGPAKNNIDVSFYWPHVPDPNQLSGEGWRQVGDHDLGNLNRDGDDTLGNYVWLWIR